MQIQSVNNYSIQNKNHNPQFKSAIPVAIWVREGTSGSYGPVMEKEISKKLTTKIVNCLNMSKAKIKIELDSLNREKNDHLKNIQLLKTKISIVREFIEANKNTDCSKEKENLLELEKEKRIRERKINEIELKLSKLSIVERVKRFIANRDNSYAKFPLAKGYSIDGGIRNDKFKNLSFLLTGDDADYFEKTYGKPIGIARKSGDPKELARSQAAYWYEGFDFIRKKTKEFCKKGEPMELHVKMATVRSKTGKLQGYNIVNMELFPKNGPNNPFVFTEWIHK